MYQLIYASQYSNLTILEVVEGIVEKAKINNLKESITGILAFSSGYFLQCLEGESSAVNKIFRKIVGDNRHFNVTILAYEKVPDRTFPFWTMAFVSDSEIHKDIYFRHGIKKFNPFKMEQEVILPFLLRLGIVYSEKLVPLKPVPDYPLDSD